MIDMGHEWHVALRSWMPHESVSLRSGSECAGTVKISPRAPNMMAVGIDHGVEISATIKNMIP